MPNIRQQEKRVRQATRQRVENLRWRSTAKTLMRRLREAADQDDTAAVGERHRELVRWLDKAAASGALVPLLWTADEFSLSRRVQGFVAAPMWPHGDPTAMWLH